VGQARAGRLHRREGVGLTLVTAIRSNGKLPITSIEMTRGLSLLIVLLLVAACTGDSDATTTTAVDGAVTTIASETTTTGGDTTTTSAPVSPPITEVDLSGLEGLSDEARAQLADLIREAQEVRELAFVATPTITVVTPEEFEELVRELIEEDTEDLPPDEALYKMLGLLHPNADLLAILLDLYGEQVAGFYDGDNAEVVVPANEEGFTVLQRGTLVHELVHALTDQHFSFYGVFRDMVDEDRLDEAAAYQALIEGDAVLAEVLWVQTLSQREIGEFIAESLNIDSTALMSAPRFLTESLIFPYDTGLAFVQTLHTRGGWEAVNEAYTTMPGHPGSTEQVINPDLYGRDLPVEVELPDITVDGYDLVRTSVWGEHGFRILLNQGSGVDTMASAANGWGGDSYHQWYDGENAAFLLRYVGDTPADTNELEAALLNFAFESFPDENFAWVDQRDGYLYFIAANETEVGEFLRAEVGLDD
jgi:hypothetical protein